MQKYLLNDQETMNVATNFSIIKHNEFKSFSSMVPDVNMNPTRLDLIALENLDRKVVEDLSKCQETQILKNMT